MEFFVRKLRCGARLSAQDVQILDELPYQIRHIDVKGDIICEGDEPRFIPLILQGWACRYKQLSNGRRQIMALFLPGDICEPFGTVSYYFDHNISAITTVKVARIAPEALRTALQQSTRIERALWWDLLVTEAIERELTVSLGQRSAIQRLGHLICELHARLHIVGQVSGKSFDLPLTQAELGEMLGLSNVHVNRTIRDLKASGLVTFQGRRVDIVDIDALQEASLFEPGYLHLSHESR